LRHVDDFLLTGDRTAINKAMNDIEAMFETRRLGPLKECIGCSYTECTDGSQKLIQPNINKKLDRAFGKVIACMKKTNIPLGPGVTDETPRTDDL
jgi:hypothetical protein